MCVSCPENAGILGPLRLRRDSCVSFAAGHHVATTGRVPVEFAKAFVVDAASPLDVSWRKDSAALADCLRGIARSGLYADNARYAFVGVHPACVFVLTLPVWAPLDPARPTATVPGLSWKTDTSRKSRSAVEKLSCLEWNGADLYRRSRPPARS